MAEHLLAVILLDSDQKGILSEFTALDEDPDLPTFSLLLSFFLNLCFA